MVLVYDNLYQALISLKRVKEKSYFFSFREIYLYINENKLNCTNYHSVKIYNN